MLRIPTLAALAFGTAAMLSPAEARPFAPAGLSAPAGAVEQIGGRWDDRRAAPRGWGYNYGDGRGYRGWQPGPPPHARGWGGRPPAPGWYYVPPPRRYGWAPPPRYVPPRPTVQFGFRF